MELRYTLAVVVAAGGEPGREVALRLARAGAAVLVADADKHAVAETARLLVPARTRAWALHADAADPEESALLARRARDLGGADVVVDLTDPPTSLAGLVAGDADHRRGPRSLQPLAVVTTAPVTGCEAAHRVVLPASAGAADVVAALRRTG